jgi:hypothetical protein
MLIESAGSMGRKLADIFTGARDTRLAGAIVTRFAGPPVHLRALILVRAIFVAEERSIRVGGSRSCGKATIIKGSWQE